ncbi:MAG: hypothetical protein WCB46_08970 [Methanoregula sp.]
MLSGAHAGHAMRLWGESEGKDVNGSPEYRYTAGYTPCAWMRPAGCLAITGPAMTACGDPRTLFLWA